MRKKPSMVEVVVDIELTLDSLSTEGLATRKARHPMLWLRNIETNLVLPIVIGNTEAMAIYAELTGEKTLRPLTHDLLRTVLDHFGAQVEEVRIVDLKDGVFYAELVLSCGDERLFLDARSSDGIALALKYNTPVYMAEEILERAGCRDDAGLEEIVIEEMNRSASEKGASDEELMLAVEGLLEEAGFGEPEAFVHDLEGEINRLKKRMERAIRQERYEEAGQLRDEIEKLTGGREDA